MGGIFELDVNVGVKHPGPNGTSIRHEYSIINFESSHTVTYSIGNVEIVGGGASISTDGIDPSVKIGGLKTDLFSHGVAGAMAGGSVDFVKGEVGARFGGGTKNVNGYIEFTASINIDLEDPDGGYNGAGLIGPGYNGYGQTLPPDVLRAVQSEFGLEGMGGGLPVGYEYNSLDRLAEMARVNPEQYGQYAQPSSSSTNHSFGDGDSSNDNDWRGGSSDTYGSGGGATSTVGTGSGGSGTEENHSLPSSTGYSDRGVYDLEGPEAAGAGSGYTNTGSSSSGQYHSTEHYENIGSGGVVTGLPIILDLDGDGVDVSFSTNVSYDMDGDGFREQTAWAAPDDGLLVIDLEADGSISATGGDGDISQAQEVAFASWAEAGATDLQALAEATDADGNLIFDSNGDGVLDANDSVWSSMKVFQDLDQDGEVDEGELKTLDEWGHQPDQPYL